MAKIKYTELTSLHEKAYGQWAGNEAGHRADPQRCCEQVSDGWHSRQCSKSRGHGPEEAYCASHDPVRVQQRETASRVKNSARMLRWRMERAAPKFLAALRQIAAGHNDPRSLAIEAIAAFPEETE